MLNLTLFGLLGVIWGSSFLLIKIGVRELDAFSLVAGRMSIAALAFGILLLATRQVMARKAADLLKLAVVGVLNSALPFVLIAWSEQWLDSSLAGVLNATTPLFSLIIAHFALTDDRITANKLFGLIVGFFGVIVLALRSATQLTIIRSSHSWQCWARACAMPQPLFLCGAICAASSRWSWRAAPASLARSLSCPSLC